MARLRRKSPVLELARQRLASFKAMKDTPDFGPNLTVAGYEAKIKLFLGKLDDYNGLLAELDGKLNDLLQEEFELNEMNRRMIAAVAAIFGPDSGEFEMLGGTRTSERKRPTRKATKLSGTPASQSS